MQKAFISDLRKEMKTTIKPETGQTLHLSKPSLLTYMFADCFLFHILVTECVLIDIF